MNFVANAQIRNRFRANFRTDGEVQVQKYVASELVAQVQLQNVMKFKFWNEVQVEDWKLVVELPLRGPAARSDCSPEFSDAHT